ncbi:MAG TPA: SDR family NAD(P)-dependent oxidoreductase [Stellaceae bacterium]|jgi:3-oxoacyl-(acyl-carrier-protein) synthase/NADPH:quinone reductase-like Zn-dependent oxidoreductase/acyl carrier protein
MSEADPRDVLRRALIEIRSLKQRLAAAEQQGSRAEPVAVCGLGCRFPGGVDGPAAFWRLLGEGGEAIGPRPPGRWAADDTATAPLAGSFLDDVEGFDAPFFEIAPREAAAMDPQHRLLLEVAWEALEHAAIDPQALAGSRTGVFVGLATNDYSRRVPAEAVDRYFGVGSSPAVASGRIAYLLDLRGPCMTLDTACSSSLVAVHYAMRALRDHDCDTALAGGVSLMLTPELGESFVAAGMLAPDGRCKSFDAAADGYGRGEGAGIVVLRRLDDALAAGDPVLAVLRGSAINQDGKSAGLTAPNGPAQTALIQAALNAAGVSVDDIDYVETHGTGTPLGDPIEWHALAAAFAGRRRKLPIGSVKTNFGHAEAASGVAGLIKAVLMLRHDMIVPSLNFVRRNPAIGEGGAGLEVALAPMRGVRRVGVSAFGFSGTNAHAVLEAAPARQMPAAAGDGVLLISARDPEALRQLALRYREAFATGLDFLAACHTAATGRARLPWWIAVRSPEELAQAVPSNAPPPSLRPTTGPRVALPIYPFQRSRFPLPGAAPVERVLTPDDALFADTEGLAHLGVLLQLCAETLPVGQLSLASVSFPAPLMVTAPRRLRLDRAGDRIALESRGDGDATWTTHLAATLAQGPPIAAEPPPEAGPPRAADRLYGRIAAAGFRYAATARRLDRIATAGDVATGWLAPRLATDEMPRAGEIEAAAQLVYALLPPDAAPVMIAAAERIDWHPGATPTHAWLEKAGAADDGGFCASFGLHDAPRAPALRVAGARFMPLADHAWRWSRVIAWRPAPARSPAEPSAPAYVWLAPEGEPTQLCAALLAALPAAQGKRLAIVTRGAQAAGAEASPPALGQAALWGLTQALIAERPALRCRLIDLDPDLPVAAQQQALATETVARDEAVVAWRDGRRLARRFEPPPRPHPQSAAATLPRPGIIEWEARKEPPLAAGMVRVAVVAAGLSFRDRLLFNGLAPAGSALGADCAGVVAAIGAGVRSVRPGDPVVALSAEAIADHVTAPEIAIAPAPVADLVAAATMPAPYLTALAALPPLGPGDRVLIHQAGSATGLAAIAVARRAGARIVATAGRQRHGWFTAEDADIVLDSRAPDSWGDALDSVTVAFGAFDAALAARLRAARVITLNKAVPGHFDLNRVDPRKLRRLLDELVELPPLPRRIVPRDGLAEALGDAGPIVGRSVVLLREPPPARIEPGATYLVTGAAGALGGLVADWLAAAGARLCLVDPRPVEAAAPHVAIRAEAGDDAAMAALFDRLAAEERPLRGVFHCAATTDDDPLELLTAERIAAVLQAKVDGAMLLDRLTRRFCQGRRQLHHFVLFSSLVGMLPSARQGAYAAANAVLDQLAHARRQRGLPALSLDWGPWNTGIGRTMGARAAETWQRFGVTPILPAAGLRALPRLLAAPEAQRLVADLDWGRYAAAARPSESGTPARERGPATAPRLQAILAPLLGMRDPSALDPDMPLTSFGFDSLTAVEFARALSRDFGRPIAPDFAYSHPTLNEAAAALAGCAPRSAGPAGFALWAPRWEMQRASGLVEGGWTVEGGALAAALGAALGEPAEPDHLVDVGALSAAVADADDPASWRNLRDSLFAGLIDRLRPRLGKPSRIVLAVPAAGPIAGMVEGFAAALAAEEPRWTVRTVRVDGALPDPAAALARELDADDGETRVRLAPQGRQVLRLRPVAAAGAWRADPDALYLVTGGSGGVGSLLAAHLAERGARHLALAGRRPVVPPALAGAAARVTLHSVDLGEDGAATVLLEELCAAGPPLRGIFHAAGITADGSIAEAGWDRLARAFPAKADGAASLVAASRRLDLAHLVLFSSTAAWFGLAGTAGYAAANGFVDGLAESLGGTAQSIAWCAWQGVGMARDPALWQGGRAPSLPAKVALAALDAALASSETNLVVTDPSWQSGVACTFFDPPLLAVTAG